MSTLRSLSAKLPLRAITRRSFSSVKERVDIRKVDNSCIAPLYARQPIVFEKGHSCHLVADNGKQYLDFAAGIAVNALGYSDKTIKEIYRSQSEMLIHCSNLYYNKWAGSLAEKILQLAKIDMPNMSSVFFSNSGTEANEAALKFGRAHGKLKSPTKYRILCFTNAFHGRTMGALSVTPKAKYQDPFTPLIPGIDVANFNECAYLDKYITEDTAAVILEPIQGEGGIVKATPEFLKAVRARCDEVDSILIYDEIQCGLGRTGSFWAYQQICEAAKPNIITWAKPLANGMPIGATIIDDKIRQTMKKGEHGTTFGGNPLACRLGRYVVEKISSPEFLDNVKSMGSIMTGKLNEITNNYPNLFTEVRGAGLMIGLQCKIDPSRLVELCAENGLIVITSGVNTIRITPPLIISIEHVNDAIVLLKKSICTWEAELGHNMANA